MPVPSYPAKPKPGDRVAVVSPSRGLPGLFPHVHELGLRRLRAEFGLEPVEYPTTRRMGADPRDRARDPLTFDSLRAALFTSGWYELTAAPEWGDEPGDWRDPATLADEPVMFPGEGWRWQGPARVVRGRTWGGCLEIIEWLMATDRVPSAAELAGSVLVVETSDELPTAQEVFRIVRNMGERGLLAAFPAIVVGRPKAWDFDKPHTLDERRAWGRAQREAVSAALASYADDPVMVFDVDLGHTDPQLIIPYGGEIRVDAVERRISVRY